MDWTRLFLMLVWMVSVVAGAVAFSALLWHLYYTLRGKPKLQSWQTYRSQVWTYGLFAGVGLIFVGTIVLVVGWNITTKLSTAEQHVVIATIDPAAIYVKVNYNTLPEASRKYVDKNDLLYVHQLPENRGWMLYRASGPGTEALTELTVLRIVAVRQTVALPIRGLHWMGPRITSEYTAMTPKEKRVVFRGLYPISRIKS